MNKTTGRTFWDFVAENKLTSALVTLAVLVIISLLLYLRFEVNIGGIGIKPPKVDKSNANSEIKPENKVKLKDTVEFDKSAQSVETKKTNQGNKKIKEIQTQWFNGKILDSQNNGVKDMIILTKIGNSIYKDTTDSNGNYGWELDKKYSDNPVILEIVNYKGGSEYTKTLNPLTGIDDIKLKDK